SEHDLASGRGRQGPTSIRVGAGIGLHSGDRVVGWSWTTKARVFRGVLRPTGRRGTVEAHPNPHEEAPLMKRMVVAAGIVTLAVAASSAFAATKAVTVSNFTFTPSTTKQKMGGAVQWTFPDAVAHTATDNTGLGLFNSGPKSGGQTFSFTFNAAGSYAVF